jgi:hypothetical protein
VGFEPTIAVLERAKTVRAKRQIGKNFEDNGSGSKEVFVVKGRENPENLNPVKQFPS